MRFPLRLQSSSSSVAGEEEDFRHFLEGRWIQRQLVALKPCHRHFPPFVLRHHHLGSFVTHRTLAGGSWIEGEKRDRPLERLAHISVQVRELWLHVV